MKINICLATDKNYIKPLACTIASILKNADVKTDLHIFILESDFSNEDKNIILSFKKIKGCEITFIKIKAEDFNDMPDFKCVSSYVSKTAFFRFLIPNLLKDIDKIIYLDSDVIVLQDLTDLFSQDIQNYYIAAIKDMAFYINLDKHIILKTFYIYINSGVLLMNLNLWRKEKISLKLFDTIKRNAKNFLYLDQDALNVVCKSKIKLLDFSYNLQADCLKRKSLNKQMNKQINKDLKNLRIVHYTTQKKPWNYFGYIPLRKHYLYYEKLTPFKTKYALKTKLKFFIHGFKYNLDKTRDVLSPVIDIYREGKNFKLKLFNYFEFNLTKRS